MAFQGAAGLPARRIGSLDALWSPRGGLEARFIAALGGFKRCVGAGSAQPRSRSLPKTLALSASRADAAPGRKRTPSSYG